MSDSLRKVLLGALIGAVAVGFAWHVAGERAKRGPVVESRGSSSTPAVSSASPSSNGTTRGGASDTGVRVVAAASRVERLSLEIEALGTARANESVEITSKVSNLVAAVRFSEGQHVRAGQVLVELDAEQERADVAVAEAALTESASQLKRSRELYVTKVLSDQQIEQIEATHDANRARAAAARARLADTVIRAPFAGRVGLRNISVGSLIEPGTVITTLDDTRTIKLDFTVPEAVVATLAPGLSLQARSIAYPGRTFAGRVASVDSRVNPDTRSVIVRGMLPNEQGALKPGMFLNVMLDRGEADVLVVPEESLLPEQGDVYVYVVDDGKASKRKVQTGQRRVGTVQVLSGLEPGELVVTEGTQKLRDGATVEVVEARRAAAVAAPATSAVR